MNDEKRKPPVTEQNKAILTPENKLAFPDPKAPAKKAKKKDEARKRKS